MQRFVSHSVQDTEKIAAKLAEKVDAHDQAEQYLHDGQKLRHICPPGFPGEGQGRRAFRQTFCPVFWENM